MKGRIAAILFVLFTYAIAGGVTKCEGAEPVKPVCQRPPRAASFNTVVMYRNHCNAITKQYYKDKQAYADNQRYHRNILLQADKDNDTIIWNSDGSYTIIKNNYNRRRR